MIRKSVHWALDFGAGSVLVLAAEERDSGDWAILGKGEAPSGGIFGAEMSSVTDAVEAVVSAVRQAELECGQRCRKLFFNYDDPLMTQSHPTGSKTLSGEGQIQRSDVKEAALNATRVVGNYEQIPVYAKEVQYLIDGRDLVGNPYGVFGHRLEVTLHVVMTRAVLYERWMKVMRRAGYPRAVPILSLLSTSAAVLEKKAPRRILWDLGEDIFSGGVVDRGALTEYAVFAKKGKSLTQAAAFMDEQNTAWSKRYAIEGPAAWTGDMARGRSAEELTKHLETPGVYEPIFGIGTFDQPTYASVTGLLRVIAEMNRGAMARGHGRNWISQVREKATGLVQEYF